MTNNVNVGRSKLPKMAGFGNAGNVPSSVASRMKELGAEDSSPLTLEEQEKQQKLWAEYSSSRSYCTLLILQDEKLLPFWFEIATRLSGILKRELRLNQIRMTCLQGDIWMLQWDPWHTSFVLCGDRYHDDCLEEGKNDKYAQQLTAYLYERMCVPWDMNALSAAHFKRLAAVIGFHWHHKYSAASPFKWRWTF